MQRYDVKYLTKLEETGVALKFLFFWGHTPAGKDKFEKSCFSQWHESPFSVDGITYPTAEHWMMAKKAILFNDMESRAKILAVEKPGAAKELGRNIVGFNETIWIKNRYEIVVEGNYHKFSQHPALKLFLLSTGERILAEASPVDSIWGIGLAHNDPMVEDFVHWPGKNLLGFALMEVRDLLRFQNKKSTV